MFDSVICLHPCIVSSRRSCTLFVCCILQFVYFCISRSVYSMLCCFFVCCFSFAMRFVFVLYYSRDAIHTCLCDSVLCLLFCVILFIVCCFRCSLVSCMGPQNVYNPLFRFMSRFVFGYCPMCAWLPLFGLSWFVHLLLCVSICSSSLCLFCLCVLFCFCVLR